MISVKGITKTFENVVALNNVSVEMLAGEVHVILGENGAGKSTLIKILSGLYHADSGSIHYDGKERHWKNATEALESGISVIHQELSVIDDLTVAENIFMGREPNKWGFIDRRKLMAKTASVLESVGLDIDPSVKVGRLSVANKQMIEIARAVSFNAKVVIMDEPTSSLSDHEVNTLFEIIQRLKEKNTLIIYISHRMNEIKMIGDRVTILKDGNYVDTLSVKNTSEQDWIPKMVGREVKKYVSRTYDAADKDVVLNVKNLSSPPLFRDVSFQLKAGEIIGFSGIVGAGRTELMRSIFGVQPAVEGTVTINGKEAKIKSVKDAISHHIGFVTEDRRGQGLLLDKSIRHNIALPSLPKISKRGFVDKKAETALSQKFMESLQIKAPSDKLITAKLSGGNQQKTVLAKWLATDCKILILDEPTRGIDVNAKSEIYALMTDFVGRGGSIIVVSSELPEILGICNRIYVMRSGEIMAELDGREATEEMVMEYASLA